MGDPEKLEKPDLEPEVWDKTPRVKQRPKVDRNSRLFGVLVKNISRSNKVKEENLPLQLHQEPTLRENVGESGKCEVKHLVKRKEEERIKTDSKFKHRNTDLEDKFCHRMKNSYEEMKSELAVKSSYADLDFENNYGHLIKNKNEEVRTELNSKVQYRIIDSQDDMKHQTKNRFGSKGRNESLSKFSHDSTHSQDYRKNQTDRKYDSRVRRDSNTTFNHNSNISDDVKSPFERKYGREVRGASNISDFQDNRRCSINREYRKDLKFDCEEDRVFPTERKYEATVEKGTNSRTFVRHSSESHERQGYSLRPFEREVNKSSFQSRNQNYGAVKEKESKPTNMRKTPAVSCLEDQEPDEEIIKFEGIKHCREILDSGDKSLKITLKNDEVRSVHVPSTLTETSSSIDVSEFQALKSDFNLNDKNSKITSKNKDSRLVYSTSTETSSSNDVFDFQTLKSDSNVDDESFKMTMRNEDARSVHLSSHVTDTVSSNDVPGSEDRKSGETGSVCVFNSSIETTSSNTVSDSQTSKNEAIPVCLSSTLTETSSNDVFHSPIYPVNSSLTFAAVEEEHYIPPPVECKAIREDSGFHEDLSHLAAGRNNEHRPQNGNSEALPELSYLEEDESYYSSPDTEQIEAISNFILRKVEEKFVQSAAADNILRVLNAVFRDQLEGQTVYLYGSYLSDLAITTSDINLVMVSDSPIKNKSYMYEVYKVILEEFKDYHIYPYEEGSTTHETKINFLHPESGVKCELAYLGRYKDNYCKMGHFLKRISSNDERVKTLILAVKVWSESLCINEVDDGKLHTIGYALMVVYFLQHCENPILPDFPCEKGDKEMLNSRSPNNSSIGELWLSFLKYYASIFDWKQNVVSVKSKNCVPKQSKCWESYWLAIEDPFTEKNIAKSVINSDIADYIKACFKSSYDYFYNPPECAIADSLNEEDESSGGLSDIKWEFSFDQCNAEQGDTFCEDCDELMDTCDNCQKKMYVEPIFTAPQMTDDFLEIVKDSLMTVYKNYMLTDLEVNERREFVKKLKTKMTQFHSGAFKDAEFSLFGSSANGFGFKNSDVDICITFKSEKVVNSISVLKDVCFRLRKDKDFERVMTIYNAQIPIVKFYYKPKSWRGDISLDNSLAIHNSNLLYTYSLLDERCKILGCAFKLLAKKGLISEVTDKALSSYSYLNMIIYFLQQTDPPVLPVLQDSKFRNNNYEINHIVEDCNVWFCKDLDYVKTIFQTENKTPVEQLWLELLDYYCAFDSDKFISIRQKEPVTVGGKKRTARLFNIQDPFIETKNLGCVVSDQKAKETLNVLRRARKMFRTPVKEIPHYVKDNEDFFFSTQSLTGRIRKEAHCDLCGKYGHEKQECTHSSNPFRRFCFRRNPNNRFPNRRRYPNNSPCKNYAPKFHPKPVYQRT